jgi:SAM-dependent methyltransferase
MFVKSLIKKIPWIGPACVAIRNAQTKRKLRTLFDGKNYQQVFTTIYNTNFWGDSESVSGRGSSLNQTAAIRKALPLLWNEINANSVLDVPCGDFFWLKEVDLRSVRYIGGDIVDGLILNNQRYRQENISFQLLDVITSALPTADVILCRDCLVHLYTSDALKAVENMKRSGATFLLTTHFPGAINVELPVERWRPLDLQAPPFNFPAPLRVLRESSHTAELSTKTLALWRLSELSTATCAV